MRALAPAFGLVWLVLAQGVWAAAGTPCLDGDVRHVHDDADLLQANEDVQPGCVVRLHNPPGDAYHVTIHPGRSGLPGRPITYEAAPGARPVLADRVARVDADFVCVRLNNRAYVVIDGIRCGGSADEAYRTARWRVRTFVQVGGAAHHLTIQNGRFTGARHHGFQLRGLGPYVIRDNVIDGAGHPCDDSVDSNRPPIDAMAELVNVRTSHALIQGNVLRRGSHNVLEIPSNAGVVHTGNVIRDNDLSNSWNRVVTLDAVAGGNLFEGNVIHDAWTRFEENDTRLCPRLFGPDQSALDRPQRAMTVGAGDIVRRNLVIDNDSDGMTAVAKNRGVFHDYAGARIYQNVFAYNDGAGFASVGSLGGTYHFVHNLVLDNALPPRGDGIQVVHREATEAGSPGLGRNVHRNNVIRGSDPGAVVKTIVSGRAALHPLGQVAQGAAVGDPVYADNADVDPRLRGPFDFRLRADSPLVDAGKPVARVRRAASGSRSVRVDDARYFFAPHPDLIAWAAEMGIDDLRGDRVRFGDGQIGRVAEVDVERNRLVLEAPIHVAEGVSVSPHYHGEAPDIGLDEWVHLVDEGFGTYPLRRGPTNPGDGNPANWVINEAEASMVRTISRGGEHVLRVRGEGAWSIRRALAGAHPVPLRARPQFELEVDVRVHDPASANVRILLEQPERVLDLALDSRGVRTRDDRRTWVGVYDGAGAGLVQGHTYRLVATLDLGAPQTLTVSVDDLDDAAPASVRSVRLEDADPSTPGRDRHREVRQLRIRGGAAQARTDIELDDLSLAWRSY